MSWPLQLSFVTSLLFFLWMKCVTPEFPSFLHDSGFVQGVGNSARIVKEGRKFGCYKMPGIQPSVICHKLDIKPGYKLVKQKLRHQGKERIEAAKEEVEKLLKVGFIQECKLTVI